LWRDASGTADPERPLENRSLRTWVWLAGITLLTTGCVLAGRAVLPWDKMFPDLISHWAAGKMIVQGQSPYDVDVQIRIQHELGWSRQSNGLGIYDFLPYYYPPWLGLACTPLVPLGYEAAKTAWFFVNLEMLLLAGWLLSGAVPGLPRSVPLVAVPLFFFPSFQSLILGQTSILILFLAALAWWLLEGRWDRAAGVALAGLTTKPQLSAVLIVAVTVWAVRQRRWGIIAGLAVTLGVLCLVSTWVASSWPLEMLAATRRTPSPTHYFPWLGTTWLLVLKTLGLRGWGLWIGYLAVAVPFLGVVLRAAWDRERPVRDVLALSLLAAFFVAPYGRHYDFPVLLIPLFVLLGGRLSEKAGTVLVKVLIVTPYVEYLIEMILALVSPYFFSRPVSLLVEWTYSWIPLLLVAVWYATAAKSHPAGNVGVLGRKVERTEAAVFLPSPSEQPAPDRLRLEVG
jgi:hypothetical protein